MAQNAICVYDFTGPVSDFTLEEMKAMLKEHCKTWTFQQEKGEETGYLHWQGRVSLKLKTRTPHNVFKTKTLHFTPTSKENSDNCFYVLKEATRTMGPWSSEDVEIYIPRQIRDIKLRDWQQYIINDADKWDTRVINILLDTGGNHGKTILKTYMGVHQLGRAIPFTNDYRDMMRMVMDTPKKKLYIIDIPRALKKDNLLQFFAGIETLKDGYAYDDRYHFKEEYFDCPNIWVFMNTMPDIDCLSKDRWKIWHFNALGLLTEVKKADCVL